MTRNGILNALNLALAVLLAAGVLLTARDIISLAAGVRDEMPETRGKAIAKHKVLPPLADYASVVKENVFGFPAAELRDLSSSASEPEPPSSAILIGTVTGGLNYAILLMGSREEVFRAGDEIPGLGRLKSVSRDFITVTGQASQRKLQLADIAKIKEVLGQNASAPLAQRPPMVREASKSSYIVDKGAVADAIENPTKILTHARMLPNLVDGVQEGFVLSEVKPGGVFHELGLRNGDVLLRINRFEISGPDAALRAFTALRGLDRVELDVIRGGNRQTLTYLIR
jgi:general secretion pathway protein C